MLPGGVGREGECLCVAVENDQTEVMTGGMGFTQRSWNGSSKDRQKIFVTKW